jgi:hypothetical protein
MLSRLRLDYGQLRQEPAIAGLDWLFTPSHKLEEHLSVAPLQASTRMLLPLHLTHGLDRPASGRTLVTIPHFHTAPLVNCGDFAFALAYPFVIG